MDTAKSHRPLKPRLCRSPQLTPARLAACRANARKSTGPRTARGKARSSLNALKHGRYAHRLTHTLEQAGERQQLHLYWEILSRISRHFQVDWPREQQTAERLARQVWCYAWKALEQVKRTEDVIENTGSWKNNMRVRIRIEGNARGRALRFVFGPRRRRRLTARVIPLGNLAELSALWRRVFCLVSGLTGEAASWDTPLPTPSTRLREEGMSLGSFVDPDFALRLLKEEENFLPAPNHSGSLCPQLEEMGPILRLPLDDKRSESPAGLRACDGPGSASCFQVGPSGGPIPRRARRDRHVLEARVPTCR